MMTALMVILLLALAVLTIGGAVKAHRLQRSAADGPHMTDRDGGTGRGEVNHGDRTDYRDRLTADDRHYIQETWKHAAGTFPEDPAVALDVAHNAVASVLHSRGIDSARIPAKPKDLDSASPEELRQELLRYEHIVNDLTAVTR